VALIDRLVRQTYGDTANTTTLFVALAWMIAFAVIGYKKTNFSCPRCGEMFFRAWDDRPWRKDWQSNPFARSCRHCGLPKWSMGTPAGSADPHGPLDRPTGSTSA
jgi:hypothetical protein